MSPNEQPNGDTTALLTDRRRPGRRAEVSPELIPILRGDDTAALGDDFESYEQDDLHEARGILMGVALSAPLWLGIGWLCQWLLS